MLHIYYGGVRGKDALCAGAAVLAAEKEQPVLLVRFASELRDPTPLHIKGVTEMCSPLLGQDPEAYDASSSRIVREFFDSAVRTALSFKFKLLILEGIFDMTQAGLLPEREAYDFLSNAPDSVEVIATGSSAGEKFIGLAGKATELREVDYE